MAEGGFFSRLFGLNREDNEEPIQDANSQEETNTQEGNGTTLQDIINFVAELQSYYYNDICKMQTDLLVQTALTQSEINFINKKIKQDQVALAQIDEILKLVQQKEREFQSVWRKSVYSFYDEIEKTKLEQVQAKVFAIIIKLCEVNTKPELESIILNRLENYRQAWNIDGQIVIPKNNNAILVDATEGIQKYRFGNFEKQVLESESEKALTPEQLDKIRSLQFEFENEVSTNTVWVYVSSATRLQLNFMRRTCMLGNDWEFSTNSNLSFDIVKVEELEQYLKGILQLLLPRRTYAVISIVIPTNDILRSIGPAEINSEKVTICNKLCFVFNERRCMKNYLTARVDRRHIPETLKFVSYPNFRKVNF